MGWHKAANIGPIDADTFLARAAEQDAHEVVRHAERLTQQATGRDNPPDDKRDGEAP